jgi:hypothetical protein
MKDTIFWDITPRSPLKVNRSFGGTFRLRALLVTCFILRSCSAYSSTLNIEATCSSETSVYFQRTIPRYIPEDITLLFHGRFDFYPWFVHSSVGIATGWTAGVRFPAGQDIFLFSTTSRPALRPTQPPIQWVPEALSPRVKRQGPEADHLLLVPRLKMVDLYLHSPIYHRGIVVN